MKDPKIGEQFQYISKIKTLEHSFNFIIFGINKENYDIIVDRDTNPSLFKLKKSEINQCIRMKNEDN